MANPFDKIKKTFDVDGTTYTYFDVASLNPEKYDKLPFTVRVLVEAAVRNCDNFQVEEKDVSTILDWVNTNGKNEIPFQPARVVMQDFTGVPAVVDLAAMRDAMVRLGGAASKINPLVPVDLVIDHSVQVDFSGSDDALEKNMEMEFSRNKERFGFLKWGSKAFQNTRIVPPGNGIVHQVNLEYLAQVAFVGKDNVVYPDSLVGTDSHTTMINGLGVLGWGVGGIEAESAMLGTPMTFLLPPVVGFHLSGKLADGVTATDLVLTCVMMLRKHQVVGKFVEFFGEGMKALSLADRATIANMAPEYGATCGFFPVDEKSLEYMTMTGRESKQVKLTKEYLSRVKMFNEGGAENGIIYSSQLSLDLSTVVPCVAGPKRPHDYVPLATLKDDFAVCMTGEKGFKAFGCPVDCREKVVSFEFEGQKYDFRNGQVVLAAITSCTNTSNPSVMLGAGLVAKKAVEKGLRVKPFIKTSLAPGSGVAAHYLKSSGLIPFLEQLGFNIVGYGCTTCIGNSGDLKPGISDLIKKEKMVASSVLSGNRNFEARVHQDTVASYLASPPLVIAFALAGTANINLTTEPIGKGADGKDVFLADIWPTSQEVQDVVTAHCLPQFFHESYASVMKGDKRWQSLEVPEGAQQYPWPASTYINNPPFFATMTPSLPPYKAISNAHVLLYLGDSITTDHISPAGNIAENSPAGRWLKEHGVQKIDFNTYGSRRGNDLVMARGTFANTRLPNLLFDRSELQGDAAVYPGGPITYCFLNNEKLAVYDAAAKYMEAGAASIIIAGKEYGSGSSRDWAAKGPYLQGVKAVIAESFERIHRSNLVGMGIVPLTFKPGQTASSLNLKGNYKFTIEIPEDPKPLQEVLVKCSNGLMFLADLRLDTNAEVAYWKNGGLLHFVLRKFLKE